MSFSCVTRSMFSIFSLLILLLITPLSSSFSPSDKVTKALVNQLCSQPTIYKHFCVAWLTFDPKTFTLDFHGLIGMVIQKTESLGHKNLEMMKGLARTTTDPKIPYRSCVTEYESSIKAIQEAKGFTSSKDYLLATNAAFTALDSIAMCEALFEQQPIAAYVSPRNLMFERMCNIDRVFTNLLTF